MYYMRRRNHRISTNINPKQKISIIMVICNNDLGQIKQSIKSIYSQKKLSTELIVTCMQNDSNINFIKESKAKLYILKRIYNNTHIPKLLNLGCNNITYEWTKFITPGYILETDKIIEDINKCIRFNKIGCCFNYKSDYEIINNIIIRSDILKKNLPFDIQYKNKCFTIMWEKIKKDLLTETTIPIIHNISINKNTCQTLATLPQKNIIRKVIKKKIQKSQPAIPQQYFPKKTVISKKDPNSRLNIVMISIDDFRGDGLRICECLKSANIKINHILCKKHPFDYPYNIIFKKEALYYCNKIIKEADIIHLKGDNILVNYKRYFKIPKNTPIITTLCGSLFRRKQYSHLLSDNQEIMNSYIDDKIKLNEMILNELCQEKYKYIDYTYSKFITATSSELIYPNTNIILTPPPINSCNQKNHFVLKDKIIIGHSPSQEHKKGTREFIIPAIKILQNKGYNIELQLLTGNNSQIIEQKKNLTLFFDQCYIGWYGTSLIEAIQFGIPSICYISEEAEKNFYRKYPKMELPIIKILPSINNIVTTLENLIKKNNFKEISIKSKEFCDRVHSYGVNAKLWNDIYQSIELKPKNIKSKRMLFHGSMNKKSHRYIQAFQDLDFQVDCDNYSKDYDLYVFRNITELMNKYVSKTNLILFLDNLKMAKTESIDIIKRERNILNSIKPHQIVFSNQYLKDLVNNLFINKFEKSLVIPNVPVYSEISKKLDKFNDNIIHIAFILKTKNEIGYYNYEEIFDKINEFKNIKLHILKDYNLEELSQYDIGLLFYNIDYDFSNYIEHTIPSEFYEYLFAGLPMIMNNITSHKHINSIYNCGQCIDSIELNRFDEIANLVKNIKINIDIYENTLQNHLINNYYNLKIDNK